MRAPTRARSRSATPASARRPTSRRRTSSGRRRSTPWPFPTRARAPGLPRRSCWRNHVLPRQRRRRHRPHPGRAAARARRHQQGRGAAAARRAADRQDHPGLREHRLVRPRRPHRNAARTSCRRCTSTPRRRSRRATCADALYVQGLAPVGNTPEEMAREMKEESALWARVVRERKISGEVKVDLAQVEEAAKELYIRALKELPPDIKHGFDRLGAAETDAGAQAHARHHDAQHPRRRGHQQPAVPGHRHPGLQRLDRARRGGGRRGAEGCHPARVRALDEANTRSAPRSCIRPRA